MYSANEFNCLDRMQRLVKAEITLSYQEGGICVALNKYIYTLAFFYCHISSMFRHSSLGTIDILIRNI